MPTYVKALQALYQAHADPNAAVPMKAYMRNQFPFLGIKTPERRLLLHEFINQQGLPTIENLGGTLLELWALPEREFQYAALGILGRFEQKLPPSFINTIETLLTTKSWWDTVDSLATHTVGNHFKQYPEVRERILPRWRTSENLWLRRTCILFQNKYKTETNFTLLKAIILENLGSQEFFINKAIGWALREYTRVDPEGVRAFVAATPLTPLSAREALKWLNRRQKDKPA